MKKCSPTTKQLYPELSVRIPSRLKRGEDAEGREVKGSDYLRPFATMQEIIAAVAASEATRMVEDDVPRSK